MSAFSGGPPSVAAPAAPQEANPANEEEDDEEGEYDSEEEAAMEGVHSKGLSQGVARNYAIRVKKIASYLKEHGKLAMLKGDGSIDYSKLTGKAMKAFLSMNRMKECGVKFKGDGDMRKYWNAVKHSSGDVEMSPCVKTASLEWVADYAKEYGQAKQDGNYDENTADELPVPVYRSALPRPPTPPPALAGLPGTAVHFFLRA